MLNITAKRKYFTTQIQGPRCRLTMLDFLDDTAYIDLDEIEEQLPNKKLYTFNLIDIEKPSFTSPQHVFALAHRLTKSEVSIGRKGEEEDQVQINTIIEYPIHFR